MVAQSCPALQFGKIAMIRFSQVSLIRGTKLLLEGADIALNPGERIGLIGANGSGKSSLFALLRGELHTDKGELDYPAQWRVAHVAQESLALDRPAVEYAIDGDSALRSLEAGRAAAVVDAIVHIDSRRLRRYAGNYSSFEAQRAQALVLAASQQEQQARERAHLQSFIDRFKAKATKARQAQSRMKMLAKMEQLAPLHVAAPFSFEFREPLRAPNPLLVLEDVEAGYPEKRVLKNIKLSLQAEQRIGLLGVNGAGKSTLIKTIAGALAPLQGSAIYGKGLAIGYFAQHQVEMLRDDESPLAQLSRLAPDTREQELRNYLGSFNFPGDMATDPVENFSGGEKARLALALIVWQRPNLLLLDEPTNHLDLETREALAVALAQFEGTLVLVSHDRHLLRATTEQFLIVSNGAVQAFDGDLDDYREWLLKRNVDAPIEPARPAAKRIARPASKNTLQSRIKRLEETMDKLNARKSAIEAQLGDPAVYADQEKLKALLLDQGYIGKELDSLESEWLEKQAQLEQNT